MITIIFTVFRIAVFAGDTQDETPVPQEKSQQEIVYIDVTITQPDLTDCYTAMSAEKPLEAMGVRLYPNPNYGLFTIEVDDLFAGKEVGISIYSIVGEKVYIVSEVSPGAVLTINLDLSFLSRGAYFVRISRESGVSVIKLVIL